MINKRSVLGKIPDDLGIKDAVHVAIVSVRAAARIDRGGQVTLNEHREAIPAPKKGIGIADPVSDKEYFSTGDVFWLILNADEVSNVYHVWDHPLISFEPPTREVQYNRHLIKYAEKYKVTYQQLMQDAAFAAKIGSAVHYPGPFTIDEFKEIEFDNNFWYYWKNETGHEFENNGTECCPDYEYPDGGLYYL